MSLDSRSFRSVGIDIGSTTTHLVFSKLTLGFVEERHKFEIVDREITYASGISLTPYEGQDTIDIEGLSQFLFSAYEEAGCSPDDVDTGAIIITGEAARRQNAERIVNLFAGQMGKFICATAGPNYEAVLAAHGSGAVELSDRGMMTVMNVDVGGGTTKIAIARKGEIVETAVLHVGARPIVMDDSGRVVRMEETAEIVANESGVHIGLGEPLSEDEQRRIAATLAESLHEVLSRGRLSELTERLMITPPLGYDGKIDLVTFSGGV
ncbi:MAG: ethanolamine ammonia-lyase reactivating factor EutA, partial [Candidatus Bathyarchaeia archaeon]